MGRYYWGTALTAISAGAFGLLPIFVLLGKEAGITDGTMLFYRFWLAGMVLFLLCRSLPRFKGQRIWLGRRTFIGLVAMGCMYATMSGFFFVAVKTVSASVASLLLYTYPVFVTLLAVWIEKEAVTFTMKAAILVSLLGLFFVLGTTFQSLNPIGVVCGLGASMVYSFYIIYGNRIVKRIPPLLTLAYISSIASVIYFLTAVFTGQFHVSFSSWGWWVILGMALVSTVISGVAFFTGVDMIGPSRASIISTLEPVVTIAFSSLLFQERLSGLQLLGGVLVLLGTILILRNKPERRPEQMALPVMNPYAPDR